jgi:hypothetical protein
MTGRIIGFAAVGEPRARFVSKRAVFPWRHRIKSLGGWRSLAARTVRDREAPGSNPGPPTNTLSSDSRQAA